MNSSFVSGVSNGFDRIAGAIRQAAERTGVDFGYLFKQAEVESGFNPQAKAKTSSATGLFQFLDQSWLSVLKQHGGKHGLGWAASCITRDASGRLCVPNSTARQAIMDLRKNPEAAALMAGEFASDNRAVIERATGRSANATDLYMGHFLGAKGAADFLRAMEANPNRSAVSVAPKAAVANRAVFFDRSGNPRSLAEVYDRFADKLGTQPSAPATPVAPAPDAARATLLAQADPSMPPQLYRALTGEEAPAVETLNKPNPANARLAYLLLARLGA